MSDPSAATPTYSNPPPPPQPAGFQLRRDPANRVLAGVCSGLARAVDLDAAWVRLAFALAALTAGTPVVVGYVIAALVIPNAARPDAIPVAPPATARLIRVALGVGAAFGVLGVLGLGLGMGMAGLRLALPGVSPFSPAVPFGRLDGLVGLALLAVAGVWLVGRTQGGHTGWVDDATPASRPTPSDVAGTSPTTSPGGDDPSSSFIDDLYGPSPSSAAGSTLGPKTPPALLLARVAGWIAVIWVSGAIAVCAGLWMIGIAEVRWPAVAGAVLAAGLGGAVVALRRAATVQPLLGALAALLIVTVVAANLTVMPGTIGARFLTPRSLADLQSRYGVNFGQLTLNLAELDLPAGAPRTVTAELGVGKLSVRVPEHVDVDIDATVGIGQLDLLGPAQTGFRLHERSVDRVAESRGRLNLVLKVGAGEIDVARQVDFNAPSRVLGNGLPVLLECTPNAQTTFCRHPQGSDFPALDCWVDGPREQALCRPVGRVDEIAEPWPGDTGQQQCRVPAGGGIATGCRPAPIAPPAPAPSPPGGPEQPYLCTKAADGTLTCRPQPTPA